MPGYEERPKMPEPSPEPEPPKEELEIPETPEDIEKKRQGKMGGKKGKSFVEISEKEVPKFNEETEERGVVGPPQSLPEKGSPSAAPPPPPPK